MMRHDINTTDTSSQGWVAVTKRLAAVTARILVQSLWCQVFIFPSAGWSCVEKQRIGKVINIQLRKCLNKDANTG